MGAAESLILPSMVITKQAKKKPRLLAASLGGSSTLHLAEGPGQYPELAGVRGDIQGAFHQDSDPFGQHLPRLLVASPLIATGQWTGSKHRCQVSPRSGRPLGSGVFGGGSVPRAAADPRSPATPTCRQ